ncbi:Uncharacterised protein [Vibrio cholerae]|nr:Uncharacterised protein [Vibrio cholerae]CSC35699.1 Uncharacterised protein [Vibrio cholerae]
MVHSNSMQLSRKLLQQSIPLYAIWGKCFDAIHDCLWRLQADGLQEMQGMIRV